jgi:hypothetical protein
LDRRIVEGYLSSIKSAHQNRLSAPRWFGPHSDKAVYQEVAGTPQDHPGSGDVTPVTRTRMRRT